MCVCTFVAFLFEGTAETALQNLTDLSEYTERRKKWESGVKFSVEQVRGRHHFVTFTIIASLFFQSLRYSCSVCKHRPRNYWPPLPVSSLITVVIMSVHDLMNGQLSISYQLIS